jgi:hypothetical protein
MKEVNTKAPKSELARKSLVIHVAEKIESSNFILHRDGIITEDKPVNGNTVNLLIVYDKDNPDIQINQYKSLAEFVRINEMFVSTNDDRQSKVRFNLTHFKLKYNL